MFQHPDVTMMIARQRQSELLAEAERRRRHTRVPRARIEDERGARARESGT